MLCGKDCTREYRCGFAAHNLSCGVNGIVEIIEKYKHSNQMCHCHCRRYQLINKTMKGYIMKKIITILFVISALTTTFANSWSNPSTITDYTMETADDGNTYFRIYMADFTTGGAYKRL